MVIGKLICIFAFAYAKIQFSHDAAQLKNNSNCQVHVETSLGAESGLMERGLKFTKRGLFCKPLLNLPKLNFTKEKEIIFGS